MPRRVGDRLGVLRDGAARRARSCARSCPFELCRRARPSTLCEHASDVLVRPARRRRRRRTGAGRARPRRGLRRAAGRGLDRPARATPRTDDLGDWSGVIAWLDEHQPDDVGQCLIHNDFRFDNLVLDPDDRLRVRRRPRLGDGHRRRPADGPRRRAGLLDPGRRRRVLPGVPPPADAPRRGCGRATEVVDWYAERTGLEVTPGAVALLRGVRAVPARRDLPSRSGTATSTARPTTRPMPRFGPAVAYLESRCRARWSAPDGGRAAGPARAGVVRCRRLRRAERDRGRAERAARGMRSPRPGSSRRPSCTGRCVASATPPRRWSRAPAGRWTLGARRGLERVRPPRRRGARPRGARRRRPPDLSDPRSFQRAFEQATGRWTGGEHDDEYDESWPAFVTRVAGALERCCARDGVTVVVSSGGPIAAGLRDRWSTRTPPRRSCRGCGARSTPCAPTPASRG